MIYFHIICTICYMLALGCVNIDKVSNYVMWMKLLLGYGVWIHKDVTIKMTEVFSNDSGAIVILEQYQISEMSWLGAD